MRTRTKVALVAVAAKPQATKPQATKPKAAKPKAAKPKAAKSKAAKSAKPKPVVEDAEEVDPELAEQWEDGYDDENFTVCQTRAINGPWGLSKKELQRVRYTSRRNPYYSCAAPMKLFTIGDLRHASLSKHGSFEALYAHLDKKAMAARIHALLHVHRREQQNLPRDG